MRARFSVLILTAVLAAGCGRSVEATWPDSDVVRYVGPVTEVDGELRADGEWRFWFPNGLPQAEGDYLAAPLPGADHLGASFTRVPVNGRALWWTFWDEDGRMLAEGQYKDGLRTKLWVCWYANGRQCCTGHFSEDLAHGYHVTWYPEGGKREERWYQYGSLDGKRTVWNESGAEIWAGIYQDGQLMSHAPAEAPEPPVHDVSECAERAESGLARSTDVASRGL
jgi:hypothetical protein